MGRTVADWRARVALATLVASALALTLTASAAATTTGPARARDSSPTIGAARPSAPTPLARIKVRGVVASVTPDGATTTLTLTVQGGITQTYTMDASTTVTEGAVSVGIAGLVAGQTVRVTTSATDATVATNVAVVTVHVAGAVTAVSSTSLTLATRGGGTPSFNLTGATNVTVSGTPGTLTNVTVGEWVVVTPTLSDPATLASILVHVQPLVFGTVGSFDGATLSVTPSGGGPAQSISVGGTTTVTMGGVSVPASSLQQNQNVKVTLTAPGSGVAAAVLIRLASVVGAVTAVSSTQLTVATRARSTTFSLTDATPVTGESGSLTISDLAVGQKVDVTTSGSAVESINIERAKLTVVRGTVSDFNSGMIQLNVTGNSVSYTFSSSVPVKVGQSPGDYADLAIGERVSATVIGPKPDVVTAVTIEVSHYTGLITSLPSNEIVVKRPGKRQKPRTYVLGTQTSYLQAGATVTVGALADGEWVTVATSDGTTAVSVTIHPASASP